jgi:hypothetical protein
MTRLFYSDPLAAAYMAKHFGMRFISEVIENAEVMPHDVMFHPTLSEDESTLVADGELHDAVCLTCAEPEDKLYLHPGSLPLLEVQLGDMVSDGINGIAVLLEVQLEQCRGARIIQRQGTPFMWPEQEAA